MSTINSTAAQWIETIVSEDSIIRNRSFDSLCDGLNRDELLEAASELDQFWRANDNLYHRVRALFFLSALYRYHIPPLIDESAPALVPFDAYNHILARRFIEAIDRLLEEQATAGCSLGLASALAGAYHQIGFQTLADQVRRSVRTVKGNQWMFRSGHPGEHPLRLNQELLQLDRETGSFPILSEKTSVRMDFTHSGWSDIFFLGMDYPEGARVINASINLAVRGRDPETKPPVEAYLRVIDRPVLRLVSVDLGAETELTEIDEVFDFAKDYLGLLKAAVTAAGIVPPAMEGCHRSMQELLRTLTGETGKGLELVSAVNDIPKGSRLAVSTNLLGCLISVLMRATGQVDQLEGGLEEPERRLVAARAILGEWLGGSGGGWQDSGGVWPGIKLIHGTPAEESDPEFGISRGRLLPNHQVLGEDRISSETRQKLQNSLILVHGGMAQNVGPILEMVTEKYLLRSEEEWQARERATEILDEMLEALGDGDLKRVGALTTENFTGPLQKIIPWCTNRFTDSLIEQCHEKFGDQFWGFWMLGGMSGGGMGFIFDPSVKQQAQCWLQQTMLDTKREMQTRLPFAMDPVVYDFVINDKGSWSKILSGSHAKMPDAYYSNVVPKWLKKDMRDLTEQTQRELIRIGDQCRDGERSGRWILDRILPQADVQGIGINNLEALLAENGFDATAHDQLKSELLGGRIGLSQNRLAPNTIIEDVLPTDLEETRGHNDHEAVKLGESAISNGEIAVMTLAAGVGSRWTGGAGVVKGMHPFCKLDGRHRSFLEIHLAKSRKISQQYKNPIPHIFTTGYLTHDPIAEYLDSVDNYQYAGPVKLSRGMSVGLRTVPTERDLRFFWSEMPQQVLDEQQQKVRESGRAALLDWAKQCGEATDYTDNLPLQCMHPVGHWFEIPNLIRNGTLHQLFAERPQLKYLLLHNIDTLGASINADLLGRHIRSGAGLTYETITRRVDDRGGGLARVNGTPRLLEGLAMPNEQDEFNLSYYNSMTTWIDIDQLLATFGLTRSDLDSSEKINQAIRGMANRLPTYITIKDVKKRWGHGQEDIYPVTQFEKLWGDMTSLPETHSKFFAVDTYRGQQLKDPAQLDEWLRDGSAKYVSNLCQW